MSLFSSNSKDVNSSGQHKRLLLPFVIPFVIAVLTFAGLVFVPSGKSPEASAASYCIAGSSTPTALATSSTPTALATSSTPTALATSSTPTALATSSTPTALATSSTPTALATSSTPLAGGCATISTTACAATPTTNDSATSTPADSMTPTALATSATPTPADSMTPTALATSATPTPAANATPTASEFTQGADCASVSQAKFTFQPNNWTAGYVVLHYAVTGEDLQSVNMTNNGSTSPWEYTIGGLGPGSVIMYSFTYQKGGLQYDTDSNCYTFGTATATPTSTPTSNGNTNQPVNGTSSTIISTGNFGQAVSSIGSNQAQFIFQPSNWPAVYVILHYTVAGAPQNINMTYNSNSSRWEYTASGMSTGSAVTYWFTYQRDRLQYDTNSYSWTPA